MHLGDLVSSSSLVSTVPRGPEFSQVSARCQGVRMELSVPVFVP